MNVGEPGLLYESLSEEVVWLMIGSFIIGEAVKESGLAERLTLTLLRHSRNKGNILAGVGSLLFATVFFIPSTSGRAALSMPIIQAIKPKIYRSRTKCFSSSYPYHHPSEYFCYPYRRRFSFNWNRFA